MGKRLDRGGRRVPARLPAPEAPIIMADLDERPNGSTPPCPVCRLCREGSSSSAQGVVRRLDLAGPLS